MSGTFLASQKHPFFNPPADTVEDPVHALVLSIFPHHCSRVSFTTSNSNTSLKKRLIITFRLDLLSDLSCFWFQKSVWNVDMISVGLPQKIKHVLIVSPITPRPQQILVSTSVRE